MKNEVIKETLADDGAVRLLRRVCLANIQAGVNFRDNTGWTGVQPLRCLERSLAADQRSFCAVLTDGNRFAPPVGMCSWPRILRPFVRAIQLANDAAASLT